MFHPARDSLFGHVLGYDRTTSTLSSSIGLVLIGRVMGPGPTTRTGMQPAPDTMNMNTIGGSEQDQGPGSSAPVKVHPPPEA